MCNGSVQANANGGVPRSVTDALRMFFQGLKSDVDCGIKRIQSLCTACPSGV
jgi:hypothetical protein